MEIVVGSWQLLSEEFDLLRSALVLRFACFRLSNLSGLLSIYEGRLFKLIGNGSLVLVCSSSVVERFLCIEMRLVYIISWVVIDVACVSV